MEIEIWPGNSWFLKQGSNTHQPQMQPTLLAHSVAYKQKPPNFAKQRLEFEPRVPHSGNLAFPDTVLRSCPALVLLAANSGLCQHIRRVLSFLCFFPKPLWVGFSFSCLTARGRGSAGVRPEVCHVCSMPCKRHWPGNCRTGGLPAEARTGPVSSVPSLPYRRAEFAAYRASAAERDRSQVCRALPSLPHSRDDLDGDCAG